MSKKDRCTDSFCPNCGWHVYIDEDGCCHSCGCQAVGEHVDAMARERRRWLLEARLSKKQYARPSYWTLQNLADDIIKVLGAKK